jgi:hypothetical protein
MMNALVPQFGDKLATLIPRLASDRDGEVVATARAIGKQLSKHGADWHDLAARLTAPVPVASPDANFCGVRSYGEAVAWIIAHEDGNLSDKERAFLENMKVSLSRRVPTPKQSKWLGDILERCGGYWA